MKVYVMTGAKPFEEEKYIGVRSSQKEAEKVLRKYYPHMRPSVPMDNVFTYVADKEQTFLLFIREEEV